MNTHVAKQALPHVMNVAAPLAAGALSGVSNCGITKALTGGSIQLPPGEMERLAQFERHLIKVQRDKNIESLRGGTASIPI